VKVSIVGGGRSVEVECPDANMTIDLVGDKALELWKATKGQDGIEGPAYGFQAQQQVATNRSTYGPASFRHGDRPVVE